MSKLTKALTAAAGNAGGDNLYVEDVFSTYLYDGTGTTNNIVNGVDLTEGGLVWFKTRDDVGDHNLVDSERGSNKGLESNTTDAETGSAGFSTFNSNGFTLTGGFGKTNSTSSTYASWTFRKAEKFFDVVTYTGDGGVQNISHNLGSIPACIIIKRTDSTGDWWTYHSSLTTAQYLRLNTTNSAGSSSAIWNNTAPTDSVFSLGSSVANTLGGSFVAYLFASDSGGFGDDSSESIIKCGTYVGSADTAPYVVSVDLGFEPQWLLVKNVTTGGAGKNWLLVDTMRGFHATGADKELRPNTSDAENDSSAFNVTSTGFSSGSGGEPNIQGNTYIYIAIRRPMKTPKSGTEVFAMDYGTSGGFVSGFPVDTAFFTDQATTFGKYPFDRLRGVKYLEFNSTASEGTDSFGTFDSNTSWYGNIGSQYLSWMFKRATGFMDVVAYTGTGSATTQAHNLGVAPDLMIIKRRDGAVHWSVYSAASTSAYNIALNLPNAEFSGASYWNATEPTASVFTVNTHSSVNQSSGTYIAYLFATLAGVSKVGSYTGTGSNLNVDCGFSAGARFILIKRTDSTGDWYVYDSVRGIVAGNDPYLLLNTTAAEVTNTDYIDPLSSGFTVTSSAPAALNASGGNYIFMAIS